MEIHKFKKYFWISLILVVVLSGLFLLSQKSGSSGLLKINFFDIGEGDSIFITLPNGQQVLIDGGPDNKVLSQLGQAMPFYDHYIDLVILTHQHADHLTGLLPVVEKYNIGLVLLPNAFSDYEIYSEFKEIIKGKNIKFQLAKAGQEFNFSAARLKILYSGGAGDPEIKDENLNSIVAKLVYQNSSFLFTGDATKEVETQLLKDYCPNYLLTQGGKNKFFLNAESDCGFLDVDVLKVCHHGSKYSSTSAFLQAVRPKFAVIQSGADNKFGHPHEITLRRLKGIGTKILRNDKMGNIEIISDGKRVWFMGGED